MLAYSAHIEQHDGTYLVTFPDLENVMTYGATLDEALANAEEALNGCIESDFERISPFLPLRLFLVKIYSLFRLPRI